MLAANVPHFYIQRDEHGRLCDIATAYPPFAVYEQAVANTERNARLANLFFRAHEVGICTVASIATLINEPNAPVPGIVSARLWRSYAKPSPEAISHLTADELPVYEELMNGKNQMTVDEVTTNRSPISGLILGVVGSAGVSRLSSRISAIRQQARLQNDLEPFARTNFARALLDETVAVIGPQAFSIIMDELTRVARYYLDDPVRGNASRPKRLQELQNDIIVNLR